MSSTRTAASPASYRLDSEGLAQWSVRHGDAWIGLLETHKRLTRTLDGELDSRYGLSLSALELLARLAGAPQRCLRLSGLAAQAGLSLSRVSRMAVTLEGRGLIERMPCQQDARAVEARLTPDGLVLLRNAQSTHFAAVQRHFFDLISDGELEVIADVFARLSPGAPTLHRVTTT